MRKPRRKVGKAGRKPASKRANSSGRKGRKAPGTKPGARGGSPRAARAAPSPRGGPKAAQDLPTLIVGLGASAGGLEAIRAVLENLPADSGMAFVFVQHLAPGHQSVLPQLLQPATAMPVQQVTDGTRIQHNRVYVVPPNVQMDIVDGELRLSGRPEGREQYTPVDHFFTSLAKYAGRSAVGIVLSGTASDGARGLREIKAAGGIAFAQDPETAAFGGMPHAALATGIVDLALAPSEIARQLVEMRDHPYVLAALRENPRDDAHRDEGGRKDERQWALDEDARAVLTSEHGSEALRTAFAILRGAKGVDFSLYKPPTIHRRIQRRMALHKITDLSSYVVLLKDDPREVEALYHDILIQVTQFFREPEALNALMTEVIPRLLQARDSDAALRVWIPGCATGEEVYSVAMLLLEAIDADAPGLPVQVFGTDVSEAAIEYARTGVYPQAIAEHVSRERLRRFFTQNDGPYRISKRVRDLCIFARQDLTRDPPFSRLDLIICRNVLIYLGAPLQRKLMGVFHYALKPTGFLVLGKAETVGSGGDLFSVVDKKHRIYARRHRDLPQHLMFAGDVSGSRGVQLPRRTAPIERPSTNVLGQANQVLLDRYAPPGVVVDANLQIIQFRGQTGPYLEPAPGSASLSLLKMAREGLLYGLRTALHAARKKGQPVRKDSLRVKSNGGYRNVSLEVIPLPGVEPDRHYLIVFNPGSHEPATSMPEEPNNPKKGRGSRESERVFRLQQELVASREYLQSMIQDLEAANEELQSANEEVLSSNEELQSTNEELDTAKEELQSINEELNTVNEELHARNEELSRVNSDLMNLLASVQVAIVIVNANLRIRRFTPMAEKLLNLIPADVGRPIGNIQPSFDGPELQPMIAEVIDTVAAQQVEVRDKDGRWYSLSVRPYKSVGNQIDGAVLALYDIDATRRNETRATASAELARVLVETSRSPLAILDADLRVRQVNQAFTSAFEATEIDVLGAPLLELRGGPFQDPALERALRRAVAETAPADGTAAADGVGWRFAARPFRGEDGGGAAVLALTRKEDRAA